MEPADVLDNVRQIADRFAADRRARQLRTVLIRSEFDELMRLCLDAKIFDRPIEYSTYVDERFMKNARPVGIDLGAP